MAKPKTRYVCQLCGSVSPRWAGQCADCGEWNSLVEDAAGVVTPFSAKHDLRSGGRKVELSGLDAEAVQSAFERFTRPGLTATGEPALGLGLPLAKRIVEAHGGTIALVSEPGEGTLITVELPRG